MRAKKEERQRGAGREDSREKGKGGWRGSDIENEKRQISSSCRKITKESPKGGQLVFYTQSRAREEESAFKFRT